MRRHAEWDLADALEERGVVLRLLPRCVQLRDRVERLRFPPTDAERGTAHSARVPHGTRAQLATPHVATTRRPTPSGRPSTDTPLGTQPCWYAEYSTQRVANWQGLGRPAGLIHRKSWKDSLSRSSRTTVDAHLHARHCELHHTHSGAVSHSIGTNGHIVHNILVAM